MAHLYIYICIVSIYIYIYQYIITRYHKLISSHSSVWPALTSDLTYSPSRLSSKAASWVVLLCRGEGFAWKWGLNVPRNGNCSMGKMRFKPVDFGDTPWQTHMELGSRNHDHQNFRDDWRSQCMENPTRIFFMIPWPCKLSLQHTSSTAKESITSSNQWWKNEMPLHLNTCPKSYSPNP